MIFDCKGNAFAVCVKTEKAIMQTMLIVISPPGYRQN